MRFKSLDEAYVHVGGELSTPGAEKEIEKQNKANNNSSFMQKSTPPSYDK